MKKVKTYRYKVSWRSPDKGNQVQLFDNKVDASLFRRLLENKGRTVKLETGHFSPR